jgi:hypothetical protein
VEIPVVVQVVVVQVAAQVVVQVAELLGVDLPSCYRRSPSLSPVV